MAGIVARDTNTTIELDTGDRLYVGRDVEVVTATGYGVRSAGFTANRHDVAVDGTVVALGSGAILLSADISDIGGHTLVIGETGVVRSLNAVGSSAVNVSGSDSFIQNWGEVTGGSAALFRELDGSRIENHGVMAAMTGDGIALFESLNVAVMNTGFLKGAGGVRFYDSSGRVNNSGEIVATGLTRAAVDAEAASDTVLLCNSGLIEAETRAVLLSDHDDDMRNSGVVRGDVDLGDGNDVYVASEGGLVVGAVNGGTGGDRIEGSSGDDDLRGGKGTDQLSGGSGDDVLVG